MTEPRPLSLAPRRVAPRWAGSGPRSRLAAPVFGDRAGPSKTGGMGIAGRLGGRGIPRRLARPARAGGPGTRASFPRRRKVWTWWEVVSYDRCVFGRETRPLAFGS